MKTTPSPKPSSPHAESELPARIRSAIGRLARAIRLTHSDDTFSPSQIDVLGTIVRRGPIGLSEVSFIEGLNPTMLSRIAGKLEAAGLIIRAQDPRDGRAAQLSATESGRMVHDRIRTERTDALLAALAQLSPAQRVALTAALPALESLTQALRRAPR